MKIHRTRAGQRLGIAAAVAALAATAAIAPAGTAAAHGAPGGTAVGPCNYSTARPTLHQGDTGPAVKQAQCYLLHTLIIDDIIEVSGNFDAKTGLRVRQFQQCAGLPSDGVVGPGTWSAFEQYIGSGRVC